MSERIEIKVPDIGDFTDVPVIEVLVSEGDEVSEEQSLITLESDKATMEVPSPAAGVVKEVRVKVNDTVSEGDVVAVLESSAPGGDADADDGETSSGELEESAGAKPGAEQDDTTDEEAAPDQQDASGEEDGGDEPERPAYGELERPQRPPPPTDVDAGARTTPPVPMDAERVMPSNVPYASPAVRAFARELGVDLARVPGSGRKQRILREDVAGFVKQVMQGGAPATSAAASAAGGGLPFDLPAWPDVDFSKFGEVEEQELGRIRRLSAGYLHRNWISIPHVTHHDEADITDMEAFRKDNAKDAEAQGFKLTPLVFLIKASVAALRKFPRFNASLLPDGKTLALKKYFHVGIAVDTPDGLVVPVLRNCERKGIMELARELAEISERARDGKLKREEMQGGCFSISSLGGIGGTSFTPIINAPEVAILGVSRHRKQPVWTGEDFEPRLMLPLSLSYDHRVIDGAEAARFTRYLATRLEDLRRLTL